MYTHSLTQHTHTTQVTALELSGMFKQETLLDDSHDSTARTAVVIAYAFFTEVYMCGCVCV
jgi:hypothetical protein